MKKSLIVLAAMAATGAFAQSSVTLYGKADVGLINTKNAAGVSATALGNGIFEASRIGFKGTEELGGGLKANFLLEMAPSFVNGATGGAATFNRGAWAGIAGGFGEVRLGRQGTISATAVCGVIDLNGCGGSFNAGGILFTGAGAPGKPGGQLFAANPTIGATAQAGSTYSANGGAAAGSYDATRYVGAVKYLSPNFSGVQVIVDYAMGGVAGSGSDNTSIGLGAVYGNGPISAVLAYQSANGGATAGTLAGANTTYNVAGTGGKAVGAANAGVSGVAANAGLTGKLVTLGGTYDFGAAKVSAGYQTETGSNGFSATAMTIGVNAPFGAATPYVVYSQHQVKTGAGLQAVTGTDARIFNIGSTYALSKRTRLFADYAVDTTSFNANKPTTLALGVNHNF
jgi:predicted porin